MKRKTAIAAGVAALALTFGAATTDVSAARPTTGPAAATHGSSKGLAHAAANTSRRLTRLAAHFERTSVRLTTRGEADPDHADAYDAAVATFTDLAAQATVLSETAGAATTRDELKAVRKDAVQLLKAAAQARKTLSAALDAAPPVDEG